jgi:cellulose synthase/poly-beta-1,6-N-acetylglucosamine synthase-like glycosyltransferase
MSSALILAGLVIALPGIATSIHLTILCIASIAYRIPTGTDTLPQRYLILVPARNEAMVIGATLASLRAATRDGDMVLVIADRCSDDTAEIATSNGVAVLERPRGAIPGKAAALNDGMTHARGWPWTAITVIDADSIVNPIFFDALDSVLTEADPMAQPRSEHIRRSGVIARVSEAAFAMQGVAFPRGREVLGIGVGLRGTGMTVLRSIAESQVFSRPGASEDLFYRLDLLLEGHTAVHVEEARLESHSAPTIRAGAKQRIRWEQGRMAAARSYVPRLIRARSAASIESAVLLMTPPFAVAAFLIAVGSSLLFLAGQLDAALFVALFVILLGIDLGIALIEARAPLATWGVLLVAPFYVVWKAWLQLVAIVRSGSASDPWEPTSRE